MTTARRRSLLAALLTGLVAGNTLAAPPPWLPSPSRIPAARATARRLNLPKPVGCVQKGNLIEVTTPGQPTKQIPVQECVWPDGESAQYRYWQCVPAPFTAAVQQVPEPDIMSCGTPGYRCYGGVCKNPVQVPTITCADSDGGMTPAVAGFVARQQTFVGQPPKLEFFPDTCKGKDLLIEQVCNGATPGKSLVSCPPLTKCTDQQQLPLELTGARCACITDFCPQNDGCQQSPEDCFPDPCAQLDPKAFDPHALVINGTPGNWHFHLCAQEGVAGGDYYHFACTGGAAEQVTLQCPATAVCQNGMCVGFPVIEPPTTPTAAVCMDNDPPVLPGQPPAGPGKPAPTGKGGDVYTPGQITISGAVAAGASDTCQANGKQLKQAVCAGDTYTFLPKEFCPTVNGVPTICDPAVSPAYCFTPQACQYTIQDAAQNGTLGHVAGTNQTGQPFDQFGQCDPTGLPTVIPVIADATLPACWKLDTAHPQPCLANQICQAGVGCVANPQATCSETDAGNDKYTYGEVTVMAAGVSAPPFPDACASNGAAVNQYYCNNATANLVPGSPEPCDGQLCAALPWIQQPICVTLLCQSGACRQCVDFDPAIPGNPGGDPLIPGLVSALANGHHDDWCDPAGLLRQMYCDGDQWKEDAPFDCATLGKVCQAGACVGSTPPACDPNDNDPCTDDICLGGIPMHTAKLVDDSDPCTDDACVGGNIVHTPKNVDDGNPCTDDSCVAGNPLNVPKNADDGNPCTSDLCNPATGAIEHGPTVISDNDPCTLDYCDISKGVPSYAPVVTDDGDACTVDTCNAGSVTHTPLCPADQDCKAGVCAPKDLCAGVDSDDGKPCTTDLCNPATGLVSHAPDTTKPGCDGKGAEILPTCDDGAPWQLTPLGPASIPPSQQYENLGKIQSIPPPTLIEWNHTLTGLAGGYLFQHDVDPWQWTKTTTISMGSYTQVGAMSMATTGDNLFYGDDYLFVAEPLPGGGCLLHRYAPAESALIEFGLSHCRIASANTDQHLLVFDDAAQTVYTFPADGTVSTMLWKLQWLGGPATDHVPLARFPVPGLGDVATLIVEFDDAPPTLYQYGFDLATNTPQLEFSALLPLLSVASAAYLNGQLYIGGTIAKSADGPPAYTILRHAVDPATWELAATDTWNTVFSSNYAMPESMAIVQDHLFAAATPLVSLNPVLTRWSEAAGQFFPVELPDGWTPPFHHSMRLSAGTNVLYMAVAELVPENRTGR